MNETRNHAVAVKWVVVKFQGKLVGSYGLVNRDITEKMSVPCSSS